ncbi:hypothetical protein KR084_003462 [Drosophila pseudotakahashii]|nr:hypothetical protein KR084_003462 [Drosophila pseudotakahashii]
MSSEEVKEVIGQGPNLQNNDPDIEEAYGAEGDVNGGQPEGNEVLKLDDNQGENSSEDEVGETPFPRTSTPMPREDQIVSMEPLGDKPSVAPPPTPEDSGEGEGDGLPPPKKFKL